MGCFSFICNETGLPANSDSHREGAAVHMYLMRKGEIVEEMVGNYDSYGCVYDGQGGSFEWDMDWGDVCDLMFDGGVDSGIALAPCLIIFQDIL
jgi:hypothetical protein